MGDIKTLEGYISLADAAERLGITKQGLHHRIKVGTVPARFVRRVPATSESKRSAVVLLSTEYTDAPWEFTKE